METSGGREGEGGKVVDAGGGEEYVRVGGRGFPRPL